MRGCTAILAASVSLMSAAALAGSDPQNAATWYRKATDRLSRLSAEDRMVIEAFLDDPGAPPSPQVRIALANATPLLEDFRRGARQEWSDFGLDPRSSADLTSHLSSLRYMMFLSRADVLLRIHDGDGAAAAERLCSIYRAAESFGWDGVPGGSLTGAAAARMADLTAQFGLDRAVFSAHDAAVMASALEPLAGRDPFNFVESLAYQQDADVQWLRDQWNDEECRREMIEQLSQNDALRTSGRVPAETLARLDDDAFAEGVGQYDGFMDQVVAALSLENQDMAREQLVRLDAELAAGAHGVVAQVVNDAGSLVVYLDLMQWAQQNIARQAATLKKLAAGETDAREQMNAAVLYAQAIELLRRMEPPKVEMLAALAHGTVPDDTPALRAAIHDALPVIAVLGEGSTRRRCDFAFLRPDWSWRHFCPAYVAGMADATCLLRADAMCRLREGDLDGATDRLVISFGIAQHLSGDTPIISSLLAHDVFNRAMELAERVVRDAGTKDEYRAALRSAVDRMGRSDPFGYLASIETAREAIAMRWRGEYEHKGEGAERIAARLEALRTFDGDRLLYMLAFYDAVTRTEPIEGAGDPAARLEGVLSMPDVQAARREVGEVTALLALGEMDQLRERPIPRLGHVKEHMRSARQDVRRATALLAAPAGN